MAKAGPQKHAPEHRLERAHGASVRNWYPPTEPARQQMQANFTIDLGWGRVLFGHTFESTQKLVEELCTEEQGRRDIAIYLRDPHVALSLAPDRLFLDPSHTYRLWANSYRQSSQKSGMGVRVRRIRSADDAREVRRIYAERGMVVPDADFLLSTNASRVRAYFVAESTRDRAILGSVTGVDHAEAFNDPENGASLWCLAVGAQCRTPGVGEALVRFIVEYHFTRGRQYVDLSVMHNNTEAISLYEKLGFKRVPAFCIKRKNTINEPYFIAPSADTHLNPYARIIVDEARRRGILVEVIDADNGYFKLSLGGRSIICRESLSELTSAVAMSRCDDKRVTRNVLRSAGIRMPEQMLATHGEADHDFLRKHGSVVVKPARGEQGQGVCVDIRTTEELDAAVEHAGAYCDSVIIEQFVSGEDLRVIVIDDKVVAAAVRRPPEVRGMPGKTIRELIERYSRRRQAATNGESRVPLDAETTRCVQQAGFTLDNTLPDDHTLQVRMTANLHTGGTIHDVTDRLHTELGKAATKAAQALQIPVVGLDLIVPDITKPDYVMIEANERPGLANHEPQPTAERFIDLLFPQTVVRSS